MKVLITGGAGLIGKATTERFVSKGWDVRVIGLETAPELPGAEFVTCDITDYDALRQQMQGCQAVVHLAAIRGPQLAAGHTLFQVNVAGTFNVFEAAAAEGIRRVVQASSINAFGCAYSLVDIAPQYLPIDEDHPTYTTDPYSYSKEAVEDIGRYFWRREGISSVALRFPAVYASTFRASETSSRYRQAMTSLLDKLAALPETERRERLAFARQGALEWRKQRPLEFKDGKRPEPLPRETEDELLISAYAMDRFNFWSFIDVRDAAQSLEKGVTAPYEGAHALFVNSRHNWLDYDSMSLVRLFFPDSRVLQGALAGSSTLVSIDKACALIGFEPEYPAEDSK